MKTSNRPDKRPYSVLRVDQPDRFTGKTYERGHKQNIPFNSIVDHAGREIMVSTFGDLVTGTKQVDISVSFQYFIDPDKVSEISTGTGAASTDNSRLKLTASSGGAGTCEVKSRVPIVYRTGLSAFTEFTASFDPYKPGTTQECGVFNYGGNGYALSINSDNKLVVNHYRAGVLISSVSQGYTISGDGFAFDQLDGSGESGFTFDPQGMNIFRIEYGYLGVAPAILEVYGGHLLGWIPFHVVEIINTGTNELIIDNPHVHMTFRVTTDGTNTINMYSGSWLGGSIGSSRQHDQNAQFAIDTVKTGLTGTVTMISIRTSATFKGKTSLLPVDLHQATAGIFSNKPNLIRLYFNPTLTGASWTPVDTDSVMEYDVAGVATGGRLIRSWGVEPSGTLSETIEPGEIRMIGLIPGDILSMVLVTQGVNAEATAGLHWDEIR